MNEALVHPNRRDMPTTRQLLKATGAALVIAGVVLTTTILPAEYGIDPTGIGKRLGLTALSSGAAKQPAEAAPAPATSGLDANLSLDTVSPLTAAWRAAAPFRTDTQTLTLQPDEGAEIKAKMKSGERFVFSWKTDGGVVNFDMHGEKPNAGKDEFSSYWADRGKAEGHGAFVAPFDGTHGWYWRNRGDKPVTITVQTSGYYEKLYRP
ncbi:MAG: hypothetical protein JNM11_07045 [Chitinimonas sp.]|nr:hypothetical protein [Chitinimonas sp.]